MADIDDVYNLLLTTDNNVAEALAVVNNMSNRLPASLSGGAMRSVDANGLALATPSGVWSYGQRTLTGGPLIAVNQQQSTVKTIVRGNSYSATARSLLITIADGAEWPTDLSAWTWTFVAKKHADNEADGEASVTGTVSVVEATGSSRAVRVDLTAAQTASMAPGLYDTSIRGTKTGEKSSINVAAWPVVDDPAQE